MKYIIQIFTFPREWIYIAYASAIYFFIFSHDAHAIPPQVEVTNALEEHQNGIYDLNEEIDQHGRIFHYYEQSSPSEGNTLTRILYENLQWTIATTGYPWDIREWNYAVGDSVTPNKPWIHHYGELGIILEIYPPTNSVDEGYTATTYKIDFTGDGYGNKIWTDLYFSYDHTDEKNTPVGNYIYGAVVSAYGESPTDPPSDDDNPSGVYDSDDDVPTLLEIKTVLLELKNSQVSTFSEIQQLNTNALQLIQQNHADLVNIHDALISTSPTPAEDVLPDIEVDNVEDANVTPLETSYTYKNDDGTTDYNATNAPIASKATENYFPMFTSLYDDTFTSLQSSFGVHQSLTAPSVSGALPVFDTGFSVGDIEAKVDLSDSRYSAIIALAKIGFTTLAVYGIGLVTFKHVSRMFAS